MKDFSDLSSLSFTHNGRLNSCLPQEAPLKDSRFLELVNERESLHESSLTYSIKAKVFIYFCFIYVLNGDVLCFVK